MKIKLSKSTDIANRMFIWISYWLAIADALVYICSFTLLRSTFEMDYIVWSALRKIKRRKKK